MASNHFIAPMPVPVVNVDLPEPGPFACAPVPSDGKFHVVCSVGIPEGKQLIELDLDLQVRRSFPAPFEFEVVMIREDRWVPRVFAREYKCSNFGLFSSGWWKHGAHIAETIHTDQPYTYHILAKLDSPMHLEGVVDVVNLYLESRGTTRDL
jgi:hypothetical protein